MESKLKAQAMDSVGELPAGYLHLPTTPIKQKPELTDWISGFKRPVRDGVYERKYPDEPNRVFCKFFMGNWYCGKWTINEAIDSDEVSYYQRDPWRGLAKNPEVQP